VLLCRGVARTLVVFCASRLEKKDEKPPGDILAGVTLRIVNGSARDPVPLGTQTALE
jgi:hypothetical protein